jgi:hypothetical protein
MKAARPEEEAIMRTYFANSGDFHALGGLEWEVRRGEREGGCTAR